MMCAAITQTKAKTNNKQENVSHHGSSSLREKATGINEMGYHVDLVFVCILFYNTIGGKENSKPKMLKSKDASSNQWPPHARTTMQEVRGGGPKIHGASALELRSKGVLSVTRTFSP